MLALPRSYVTMGPAMNEISVMIPYCIVAVCAFLINLPLGYFRVNYPKFSGKWWLLIHASIPLIIWLRVTLHTAAYFIPVSIALAIAGQVLGGRWRKAKMTSADLERLAQIPDLNLPRNPQQSINSEDVLVALLNMGGPRTNEDVKPFLLRLFYDDLILRFPLSKILQKPFAQLLVKARLKGVKERYNLIGGGSPIYPSTEAQVKALAQELASRGHKTAVTYSFNYSEPLPEETILEAKQAGKKYLLPLPLYPHYSAATTASNVYYLQKAAQANYPALKLLECDSYYLDDQYIEALAQRIQEQVLPGESLNDFYLLFSAHGLPLYFLTEGDQYPYQVAQTIAKILAKLNRTERWVLSYQSAVGPLQWLKPSTDDMLETLAQKGIKKLLVCPVSFVTDHIETLCEIDIEYRELAHKVGITDFRMSKAIECHPGFIKALADCIERSLGWKSSRQPSATPAGVQTDRDWQLAKT